MTAAADKAAASLPASAFAANSSALGEALGPDGRPYAIARGQRLSVPLAVRVQHAWQDGGRHAASVTAALLPLILSAVVCGIGYANWPAMIVMGEPRGGGDLGWVIAGLKGFTFGGGYAAALSATLVVGRPARWWAKLLISAAAGALAVASLVVIIKLG